VIVAAGSGPSPLWFATRATGLVALMLLTVSIVLGILVTVRFTGSRWPRFLTVGLHRNLALLVIVFVVLHVVTTVLDTYTSIGLLDAVIPFLSNYRPFWLGLGAVAFDLLLAVTITSVIRVQVGHRLWRVTHWATYACWPIAVIHGLGTGTDPRTHWVLMLTMGCVLVVLSAFTLRLAAGWPERGTLRAGAAAIAIVAVLGGGEWARHGPLLPGWSPRAGTPLPAGQQPATPAPTTQPAGSSAATAQASAAAAHPSAARTQAGPAAAPGSPPPPRQPPTPRPTPGHTTTPSPSPSPAPSPTGDN
jgi:methionine sulfoxide reductase heme-binding subunit